MTTVSGTDTISFCFSVNISRVWSHKMSFCEDSLESLNLL